MSAERRVLHLICQAHLDPVWLWPRRDGAAEALTTLQSAVDRLDEDPALRFSQCSMALYRWVEEQDPRLFSEIRRHIARGAWEVVGAWEVQPDCNVPAAESFLRQAESGRAYAQDHLGVRPRVLWNPDSFGHAAGLPTLLKASGFDRYVMMRPSIHERDGGIPHLFWWEGPDGARVLTWHIPNEYGQSPAWGAAEMQAHVRQAATVCFPEGARHGCCFIGVGNHGGGPTRIHLQAIRDLMADPSLPELRFSTLDQFFDAAQDQPGIPVINGELQRHAPGCYPLHAGIKTAHRRAEGALLRAEALTDLAGLDRDLTAPWRELLFNQFHDILAGTCTAPGCTEALAALGGVTTTAEQAVEHAVGRIARAIDTRGAPGGVLTLVNALPWARTGRVGFDTFRAPDGRTPLRSWEAPDGTRHPLQWLPAEAHFGPFGLPWGQLTASVPLPPSGWTSGRLVPEAALACPDVVPFPVVRATCGVRPWGWSGPIVVRVLADRVDTWGHGADRWDEVLEAIEPTSHRTITGPVVGITRVTGRFRNSRVVLEVWRWADDEATADIRIAWEGRDPRLAVVLDLPVPNETPTARSAVAGAIVERPADGRLEHHQDWVAYGGLTAFPEAIAGHDAGADRLRLHLVRTVPFAEHDPFMALAEDGHTEVIDAGWTRHRVLVHPGELTDAQRCRRAAELRFPAERFADSGHPGQQPTHRAGVELPQDLAFWSRRRGVLRGQDLASGAIVTRPA